MLFRQNEQFWKPHVSHSLFLLNNDRFIDILMNKHHLQHRKVKGSKSWQWKRRTSKCLVTDLSVDRLLSQPIPYLRTNKTSKSSLWVLMDFLIQSFQTFCVCVWKTYELIFHRRTLNLKKKKLHYFTIFADQLLCVNVKQTNVSPPGWLVVVRSWRTLSSRGRSKHVQLPPPATADKNTSPFRSSTDITQLIASFL